MVVYKCQFYFLHSPYHLFPPLCPQVHSLCLCLYSCLANNASYSEVSHAPHLKKFWPLTRERAPNLTILTDHPDQLAPRMGKKLIRCDGPHRATGRWPDSQAGAPLALWVATGAVCAQPCPTLCDPMDCSPPGSSVHGILKARILEWVAVPSSRGSSRPVSLMPPALADGFFTTSATWEAQGICTGHPSLSTQMRAEPESSWFPGLF